MMKVQFAEENKMAESTTIEEEVKFRLDTHSSEKDETEKEESRCSDIDGCFAWLVAFMSFVIYALSGGVCTTGGIIVPELLASFPNTDEASVTLVVSMASAMMNFSGKLIFLVWKINLSLN